MLGRLGFMLIGAGEIRNEGDMQENAVLFRKLQRDLTDSLQKRLAFDIADRTADLGDDDVGVGLFADLIDKFLDLIGNMRNDLDGLTEVFALTFLIQNVPIHLTGRKVGIFIEIFVDKAFVVTEVKVGFRAVLRNENFTVLIRTHCAGIDVHIRVELLSRHL